MAFLKSTLNLLLLENIFSYDKNKSLRKEGAGKVEDLERNFILWKVSTKKTKFYRSFFRLFFLLFSEIVRIWKCLNLSPLFLLSLILKIEKLNSLVIFKAINVVFTENFLLAIIF